MANDCWNNCVDEFLETHKLPRPLLLLYCYPGNMSLMLADGIPVAIEIFRVNEAIVSFRTSGQGLDKNKESSFNFGAFGRV